MALNWQRRKQRSFVYSRMIQSAVIHVILLLFVFLALFPIYLMFNAALKTSAELFQSFLSLPKEPQFQNFAFILNEQGYKGALLNSMILSTSSMILTTVISVLAGYGFAVYRFVGKQWLFLLVLTGLMVSETSVLIPVYQLLQDLGLLNTHLGMILPQAALGLTFGVFLMTTFFRDIPRALIDAAVVDGGSDMQVLRHVIMPLARPAIMSLALIEFMWAWNSFFFPLVIATKQWLMPMSVRIIDFMGRFTFKYDMIATTTVILFTPILVLYLVTQRSFHRGITFGALKD